MPNDPRGSSSHAIRCDVIGELGELHHGRKRVQSASGEIREFYREAAKRLKHQLLMFDERDRRDPIHPVWGGAGWKVFLDHPDEVRRTIGYIEENPMKIGLPRQRWEYICDYDGWPLHPGHSPRSPYARALRAAGRYP